MVSKSSKLNVKYFFAIAFQNDLYMFPLWTGQDSLPSKIIPFMIDVIVNPVNAGFKKHNMIHASDISQGSTTKISQLFDFHGPQRITLVTP